jgi:MFS family permease
MNRSTAIVASALLVAMLGSNLPAPLYEVYRVRFGLSEFMVTLVFATYPFALAGTLALFAPLPDRIGRRPVLVVGLIAAAAGSLAFACASDVAWLVAGRLCAAVAIGAIGAAGPATLVELDPQGDRRRAALVATFALSIACGLAPFLTGALAASPDPLATPYAVHIVLCAGVLAALRLVPETRPATTERWEIVPRLDAFGRRSFITAALGSGVVWWLASLFVSLLPAYVARLLGVHDLLLQGALALTVFVVSPLVQTIARKLPDRTALRSGLAGAALAFGALVAAAPAHSVVLFALGSVLAGGAQGLGFLGAQSTINRIATAGSRARLTAGFYAVTYVCIGVPILITGALSARLGLYAALAAIGAVVVTLGLAVALAVPRPSQTGERLAA